MVLAVVVEVVEHQLSGKLVRSTVKSIYSPEGGAGGGGGAAAGARKRR